MRIKGNLFDEFPDTHLSYQPKRGTREQILALQQLTEKILEYHKEVFDFFIDYGKKRFIPSNGLIFG